MAGHSKWANIKHRKAGQDAKRGKIFTKLIRELAVAAKIGGGDVATNPRLRTVVDKALSHNMTRDTIQRTIQRGVGGEDSANIESITYEGYGPGGTAVLVECLSDNRNRTVSEVRYAFSKCGGNLGTDGSVAYLFEKQGVISFTTVVDEEVLFTLALEAGAHDVITHAASDITIVTQPDQFNTVQAALATAGYVPQTTELTWVATTQVMLDASTALQLLHLIDLLEDLDDVQAVHHNATITDALAAELSR